MKEIGFRVVLCQDGVVQKVGHTHNLPLNYANCKDFDVRNLQKNILPEF